MYTTLISAEQLLALRAAGARHMVFDCSFDLMAPTVGAQQYHEAHIPGAVYANLDTALSDKGLPDAQGKYHTPPGAASGGRHPLPSLEKFSTWLSSVGFANDMQAVVYDRQGANYCGRLWFKKCATPASPPRRLAGLGRGLECGPWGSRRARRVRHALQGRTAPPWVLNRQWPGSRARPG